MSIETFRLCLLQGTVASLLTTTQLHKRAERVAQMVVEQGRLSSGDNVALLFLPGEQMTFWLVLFFDKRELISFFFFSFSFLGVDFIVAVFACLYAGKACHLYCIKNILKTVPF